MKSGVILAGLLVGLTLSANTQNQESISKEEKVVNFKAGKNKVLEHTYYPDGSLKSFDIAKTDVQKGMYTEYYENGNLKSFTIIK
jgi:antitoxin component YwqK of YwqJK toxin-antitoxin module